MSKRGLEPRSTASLQGVAHDLESTRTNREDVARRRVGAVLAGRFALTRLLGVGAYGEVYEATDLEEPSSSLALKLLRRSDAHALYSFKREFRGLSEVSHPNIVTLHELFMESEQPFFTMELVRGQDFCSYVRPDGVLDLARLQTSVRGLCAGVAALHRSGRLHRDLKPSNVLVDTNGRVVLVDFGLMAALHDMFEVERGFVGTPAYAAPEQLSLGAMGPGSDWYAVGTMIHEALHGQLPFDGPFEELLALKTSGQPVRGPVPDAELAALGASMMEPRPEARAGLHEVERWLGALPAHPIVDAPMLVGRDEPLAWLESALSEVEQGARVCCVVTAPSGLGKTALIEHFLERASASGRALVLQGRCYVNEDVSYCAMDGVADALAHYLLALPRLEVDTLVPRHADALARLFPVLLRVPSIAAAPILEARDPSRTRDRGAKALRELLGRMSDRLPVIVFVDDLQWDDTDSAWLLATLLAEPNAPRVLFVGASREQSEASSHVLSVLEVEGLRRHALGPLSAQAVRELAHGECDADLVLRESGGHPLFALELIRGLRANTLAPSLQSSLRARLLELSAPARRLLELCCAAGHRLRVRASLRHANADVRVLRELLASRLLSATGVRKDDTLEPYHDRIREAVLAELESVRALRLALAEMLLAEPSPRYELVVEHYLAAGESQEAARHALAAADASVLALHRLPGLLELAYAHAAPDARPALHQRLGDASSLVGRTADACTHYRAAATLTSVPERRWELRRMAMVQAFRGGDDAQGDSLLRELDSELGVRPSLIGVLRVIASQLRWALRGAPTLRSLAEAPNLRALQRLSLAWSAALCLVTRHVLRSQHYATIAFREAAALGHAGIYASLRATFAMAGAVRTGRSSAHVEREIELSAALAEDPASMQFVNLGRVAYSMYTAQNDEAYRLLTGLLDQPLAANEVGTYVRSVAHLTSPTVFFWSGRLRRGMEQVGDFIRTAREHADLHLESGLRALAAHRYLCDDDHERAAAEWSAVADKFPGHTALRSPIWGAMIGLYAGRIELAERAFSLASRVFLHWNAHVRADRLLHSWVRGSIAAARIAAGDRRLRNRFKLAASLWLMRLERDGKHSPFFLHLAAVQAFLGGRSEAGLELLERAERTFRALQFPLFAACAAHALARLHPQGSDYSQALFTAERLRRPDRWERALLAGLPGGDLVDRHRELAR